MNTNTINAKQTESALEQAAAYYEKLRSKIARPAGYFDEWGIWKPAERELQPCCRPIALTAREHRFGMLMHCKGCEHIAHKFRVPEEDLRRHLRTSRK